MDWTVSEPLIVADATASANGTYYATYTNVEDESKELTARVSIDGMWKETLMTVYFPPIVEDSQPTNNTQSPTENSDSEQQSEDDAREQALDLESDSIAMLALLLLLNIGVVAAIIVVRSRSRQTQDNRQRAMAEFEKSLFDESGPVASPPAFEPSDLPSMEPGVETEEILPTVESESTNTDLPNFGDLLDDL